MASVEELKARSKAQIDSRFSFKSWLTAAQRTRNLAAEADAKGDLEGAYVGYRKTTNLIRALLDHPEYKSHVTHKNSPEYYSYMDLKSKLLPTTSRMQELERILTQREQAQHPHPQPSQHHDGTSQPRSSSTHQEEHVPPHHVHDMADMLNSLSTNVTPSSTGGSVGSTSRSSAQMNGALSKARATPPPIPSSATKPSPPVPSSATKPSFPSAAPAKAQPLSPASASQPISPPATHHSAWASMGTATHKVSNKLKERMAALHNAGMKDVHEYHHDDPARSSPSTSSHDGGKPALAPKPSMNGGGLRRSPALHYGHSSSASDHSIESSTTLAVSHSNGDVGHSLASTVPSAYSQDSMPDPWPPKTLAAQPSNENMRKAVSPPHVSTLHDGEDRPGSAPPATNGPPDASGPASTSVDWLTRSYDKPSDTYAARNDHDRYTSSSPPLDTSSTLDSFTNRFPDVEHGDPFPSTSDGDPAYKSRQGGITQPFLPAPTSQNTLQYQGHNVRSGRSNTQSTVQTQSTGSSADTTQPTSNGYLSHMSSKAAVTSGQMSKPPRPLPKPPNMPSMPNRSTTTIDSQELWRFLEASDSPGQPSVLLIDVRNRKDFSGGHVKGKAVCIEPFTLSSNSTAASIENSLEISPENERKWFRERASFDLIVMYDRNTKSLPSRDSGSYTNGGPRNSPVTFRSIAEQVEDSAVNARTLATLSQAIYELNFSEADKRLKRSPLLLVGGFEAWAKEIGEKGIQREAYNQPQYHHYHQYRDRPHEHHSLPPLQPIRPHEQQSKVESEYQSMLANRAQAESTLASRPQSEPSDVNSDNNLKRQYRKAVLSGDGILSPSPLQHQVQMPGPPPPAYSGVPAHPVAVHRTGPASPYEAYPSSSFQSMPFSQRPPQGEYFDGYSSSQKNGGYPATQPGASYPQHYPVARAIEYPTLQQKQQFGSGPTQRPGPSMALDQVDNVRRPPPTLARAASSSLHLYQSGDYLNAPVFGAFPKPLLASGDGVVGLTGLKNLGNTCYMNSMVQCLSATIPLSRFFRENGYKNAINRDNPLGTKGVLADAVAQLLRSLWSEQYRFLAPVTFREAICRFAPQFKGSDQHDSQEFLAFLLDGLHEDLNLVRNKPAPIEFTPEREKELEELPTQIAAEREWNIYLRRDDSIIVRLLQGQYKSQLRCLTCGTTSTTYNTFMYLSLPIPSGRGIKEVTLAQCIDFFTQPETLDGDDAWNCSKCKQPRRATKALTISRLPPILLIHLKRFSFHGPFTDKIDTAVNFPVRGLDMSRHLPPPLSPHTKAKYEHAIGHALDEPTTQVYDLHAVSNHFGNLSSGHYTAFVRNRGQWNELNDSKIGLLTEAQVASATRSAYTLWYSRRQS